MYFRIEFQDKDLIMDLATKVIAGDMKADDTLDLETAVYEWFNEAAEDYNLDQTFLKELLESMRNKAKEEEEQAKTTEPQGMDFSGILFSSFNNYFAIRGQSTYCT